MLFHLLVLWGFVKWSVGLKGVPQDGIIVDIQSTILHVIIHTPEFDPFDISLELYKPVDPALSTYQYTL